MVSKVLLEQQQSQASLWHSKVKESSNPPTFLPCCLVFCTLVSFHFHMSISGLCIPSLKLGAHIWYAFYLLISNSSIPPSNQCSVHFIHSWPAFYSVTIPRSSKLNSFRGDIRQLNYLITREVSKSPPVLFCTILFCFHLTMHTVIRHKKVCKDLCSVMPVSFFLSSYS